MAAIISKDVENEDWEDEDEEPAADIEWEGGVVPMSSGIICEWLGCSDRHVESVELLVCNPIMASMPSSLDTANFISETPPRPHRLQKGGHL